MDDSLYDEFGNYIGGDLDDDDDGLGREEYHLRDDPGKLYPDEEERRGAAEMVDMGMSMEEEPVADRSITLYEDKQFYPDAEDVYPGAETLIQEEDTQPITEPIIAPVRTKNFDLLEKELPETSFSFEFLAGLMEKPDLIRNVCLVGHLHHGKTLFMDMLVQETHFKNWAPTKKYRYTDTRLDEQERELSVKALPMSLVLQNSTEKSFLFNIFDTPGHVNFSDECTAAMRLCDGAVVVVDALEGVMLNTQRLLKAVVEEGLDVMLVINQIDRLALELRVPPADAYHKLRHTIDEVNKILAEACRTLGKPKVRVSPQAGNVAFASGLFGFVFTLQSFAKMYADAHATFKGPPFDVPTFARALWGDVYASPGADERGRRSFHRSAREAVKASEAEGDEGLEARRTFVEFILEPFYKICAHCVGEERAELEPVLASVGVVLRKDDYALEARALLRKVCGQFFGGPSAFVDMVINHVEPPSKSAGKRVRSLYTGNQAGEVAMGMKSLDSDGPLMVYTTKCYHRPDCTTFDVFGRVMSGTLHSGQRVRVLGEAFSLDDDEDMALREVDRLWVYEGRYRVEVSAVPAGNWVLIGGVDSVVSKTSTITSADNELETEIFAPLKFNTASVIKIACEPLNPSELPKMLDGLRRIDRAYPLAKTKVEESGEHVLLGTGELFLDCALHDLRKLYGDLEIKVADPVVQFAETVMESSSTRCYAETPNKKNKLFMIAEQLEKGIGEEIEEGLIRADWDEEKRTAYFQEKFEWDVLAASRIWAFGPDSRGPNVLLDDTLPSDVNPDLLNSAKEHIVQGFQWASREGPLIEEQIRNTKFKVIDAVLASEAVQRGGGQVIPTARRVAYSSFLLAGPRLMEPVLFAEIQCPADCVAAVYNILGRRRGHVSRDLPKAGTPLYIVHGFLPAIESFGFETDLRIHTSGQAFCLSCFDHWAQVPGDPLDKSIVLRPLEPAAIPQLAREFLLKTRRRKGLSEDVPMQKYFDEKLLEEIANQEADIHAYF
uniref:Tr-type G domain-containing protein n=1 Tax=Chromera velia CCMP2878 TaxID=1169474 RepID=A0A0G4G840_9ALVE|mmetsp:Transcript_13999/g.27996  ORF Transcript_13999/g.27996 Transcript_13999/m.27996 type:complete len:1007 (+) Transcript_13999:267-3287(+)|eukprot:Cvel_20700.t1-p1 / transcript=Cvel_20700.t1 / gene=Cvel_20700 / organism=Chromera_velia_CCMP2878 / gene_product=116 kDa U5 small nuclear ribonucleoprotein, putative / transcript_product=116 kDa U5 small nuclear ribonucleoprotein, putative / location=Cvel_scaffold1883:22903-31497(-) / protein_length=1006 / sequence_SO=supercontig / SO=protein_coding / is_pseudo=false